MELVLSNKTSWFVLCTKSFEAFVEGKIYRYEWGGDKSRKLYQIFGDDDRWDYIEWEVCWKKYFREIDPDKLYIYLQHDKNTSSGEVSKREALLEEKIRIRREQIENLDKKDDSRKSLENELQTYIHVLGTIRKKK